MSIRPPSFGPLSTSARNEDEQYKLRDDADRVKRYAELAQDKDRHKKVLDHIRNEHRSMMGIMGANKAPTYRADEGIVQPRPLARSGRKRSSRVPRRRGRR